MITLRNLTLRRGPKVLLQDVNWTIYHKQRFGIIGANGSGKSSLFALLLNELQADRGDVEIPRQLTLAHVAQETAADERSALAFVLSGDAELGVIEQALLIAEQQNDGIEMAKLHTKLADIDAYTAEARAGQLLSGLGFSHPDQQKPVKTFSGGFRVRINLAKALMCRSDVLLLDEPTNHLDLDAVLWLEQWLLRYTGTLLLISHDRDFLDKVVGHIAHVADQQLKIYSGNYSAFEKQRAAQILLQQAAFEKQQKQIAHLQSFVDRFRAKASKARQAQSRMKAIERMDLVSVVQIDAAFEFHFQAPHKCPTPLATIREASIAYGDHVVLTDLSLSIAPKDRIALLGPNGAGKTSFIKLIAGEIPAATGTRSLGDGLKIGYFAQQQIDYLTLSESPLYHLRQLAPNAKEQELRTFLGSFGFIGAQALEPVKHFSGGEKSRLALALIIWQKPNLLLLDEPTNHLDLDMRHSLSMALQEYAGALILVSHDRFLVRTTVDQLLLIADQKLTEFEGDLDEYESWLVEFRRKEKNMVSTSADKMPVSRKTERQQDAKKRRLQKPLLEKIKQLETTLETLEQESAAIELTLTDLSLYEEAQKVELKKHLAHQAQVVAELNATEQQWLLACEELKALSA